MVSKYIVGLFCVGRIFNMAANSFPKQSHNALRLPSRPGLPRNLKMADMRTLRLSGNSDLPAYPGFMVMKVAHVGSNFSSVPSNKRVSDPEFIPEAIPTIHYYCLVTFKCYTRNTVKICLSKQ